jgi:acyl carrier protein
MATETPRDEKTILEELTPIFRQVLEDDQLVITALTTANDVAGWDSLSHMNLIVAVEDRYDMKFKLADIVKFKNVGEMCRAVLKAGR